MDHDMPRLPDLLTNLSDDEAANNSSNIANDDKNAVKAGALKAEDYVKQPDPTITSASPGTVSDSSSKPQRRRNKPSLSCETCTVSSP